MNELQHHGILGMKWGKRNGPPYPLNESNKSFREKRLDDLKSKYRSKTATASDHYERSIKRANDAKDSSRSKKDRKLNKYAAVYQYDKGKEYEAQAAKLQKKLKRKGVSVHISEKQAKLWEEAGELFVKKNIAQTFGEDIYSSAIVGAQFVAQQLILGRQIGAIGIKYSKYKLKD